MKKILLFPSLAVAALGFLTGCETLPSDVEKGPHGTIAYLVPIEASDPGARIEVNGEFVGNTPVTIKIFGDRDGTFHDFGSEYYMVKALPLATNQYQQAAYFGTGRWFGREDKIPSKITFDMNKQQPAAPPNAGPYAGQGAYPYPYPYYYGPGVYVGPPAFYGPRFHVWVGPGYWGRHY
jgi:hypothetical protein